MSRIGRLPVEIPKGTDVKVEGNVVTVKGPKGELKKEFHKDMKIVVEDGKIFVKRPSDEREHKALHGLTRALIQNMIEGVNKGFEKTLEVQGVGYRVQKQGKKLVLSLGFSHPVEVDEVPGIEYVVNENKITVKGVDKQLVGQVAAQIRSLKKPDPYLGKGIKYSDEVLKLKEGKTGKK
ncbi:large subunit ribosomal protein L6 [Caldanaerobius fijiensis DSM 17918]|uniref:Large ribosomal subunit protein uL6 n=1 Tax=Caldanaerobius fijiensis DSM 17918 TaxID=1121256 RepID=A0A1M4YTQ5_9THEO|nr:50S ribosomal protein L6 [Caldanaerobius fijiensis]SHF09128.1 large subunit ribosomal protein L6 [Caldanaerobius fijiensis DSM 17918]